MLPVVVRVQAGCQDQLEGNKCEELKLDMDVCHHKDAVDVCPKTCGFCVVVDNVKCRDHMKENQCTNFKNKGQSLSLSTRRVYI